MSDITPIRQAIHDMRNCVNVINLVTRSLARQREDEAKFIEGHELLQDQVREMSNLLKQVDELTVGK